MNNVNPLHFIKMLIKCHMLKFPYALYLLTLLNNNIIVKANSFDPDQQQSILCLHCVTHRLLKHFSRG